MLNLCLGINIFVKSLENKTGKKYSTLVNHLQMFRATKE